MARKTQPEKKSVSLSLSQIQAAIPRLKKRLDEVSSLEIDRLENGSGEHVLDGHQQKINSTLREIYGSDSVEYDEYSVHCPVSEAFVRRLLFRNGFVAERQYRYGRPQLERRQDNADNTNRNAA